MIRLFTLGLLALGCRAGQNYDDVYEGPVHGKVSGLVTSIDGSPLSGVNVSAQDVPAVTSEDGTYTLLDMDPGENIVVQFSKEGYARNYTTATLHSWETAASNASLIEADGFVAIDSTTPSNVEVFGTKIRFLENSFFNSDGSQYTGEVTVQVTHVDPSTQEVWGAPTDLTAIGHSTPSDGRAKDVSNVSQLVSYGMVDVALFGSDGQELNISSDTPAFLEIPITNGDLPEVYQLTPGDTQASCLLILKWDAGLKRALEQSLRKMELSHFNLRHPTFLGGTAIRDLYLPVLQGAFLILLDFQFVVLK